jgi:hypothetical protein
MYWIRPFGFRFFGSNPQPGGPSSCIYVPRWQSGFRHRASFSAPSTTRSAMVEVFWPASTRSSSENIDLRHVCEITWTVRELFNAETERTNTYLTENNQIVRFEIFTAVIMKNSVFWDITPCSPLKELCFLRALRWFLSWRIHWPWTWRPHVHPKRRLTLNGLHGIIFQKTELSGNSDADGQNCDKERKCLQKYHVSQQSFSFFSEILSSWADRGTNSDSFSPVFVFARDRLDWISQQPASGASRSFYSLQRDEGQGHAVYYEYSHFGNSIVISLPTHCSCISGMKLRCSFFLWIENNCLLGYIFLSRPFVCMLHLWNYLTGLYII